MAYAAALLGVRAVVVVPSTAPRVKTDAIEYYGAELVTVAPTMAARVAATEELAARHGYVLIPPFDDRAVIAGQGTIGLEIAADCPQADLVLVPVSGGGLISGIAAAIRACCPGAAVVGVEPELAADARDSFRRGERVAWPAADVQRTIADALRVEQVGELPFAHIRELVTDIVTVSEDEMLTAVRLLARRPGWSRSPAARPRWRRGCSRRESCRRPRRRWPCCPAATSTPRYWPASSARGDRRGASGQLLCWRVMRTTLAYTSARILLFVVSIILLYLVGARGLLLLVLACLVSGIASFVLLSRQRDVMSGALMARIRNAKRRATGFRARLEEGARAEDDD